MQVLNTKAVCELIGVPVPDTLEANPDPRSQESVIWYPGWTFEQMIAVPALVPVLDPSLVGFEKFARSAVQGYFGVRLAMQDSERKSAVDQCVLLRDGEHTCAMHVAAFTLAVHLLLDRENLPVPQGIPIRCSEKTDSSNVVVRHAEGRVSGGLLLPGGGRARMAAMRRIGSTCTS